MLLLIQHSRIKVGYSRPKKNKNSVGHEPTVPNWYAVTLIFKYIYIFSGRQVWVRRISSQCSYFESACWYLYYAMWVNVFLGGVLFFYKRYLSPHHTPYFCCMLPLRAHVYSMSIDRANLSGNIGTDLIVIYIPNHPYIYVHMFCVEDIAHSTDGRHQTTWGQHNATFTTLPHSSSSRIHHVRARGESSLCCGELLLPEPVISHSTIPHLSAVLQRRGCALAHRSLFA